MQNRIKVAIAVLIWTVAGSIFYFLVGNCYSSSTCSNGVDVSSENCGWTFPQSFYYSVQTGLSIGFGLLSETKDISRLYSILHICTGASFIAGALGFFASAALERQTNSHAKREGDLARFARSVHTDLYEGFSMNQLRDLYVTYPQYLADLYYKLEKNHQKVDELMVEFYQRPRKEQEDLTTEALRRARSELGLFSEKATMDDIMSMHRESRKLTRRLTRWVEKNSSLMYAGSALLVWILAGAIFGMAACEYSFITGVYFAVAGLSTAGLQAICEATDANMLFVGFWALTGVPIMGLTLGFFANVLVDDYIERQASEKMHQRIKAAEINFAKHLLNHSMGDKVNVSEYIEIQLLRLGNVDRETLEMLKEKFESFQPDENGTVSKQAVVTEHQHKIDAHKNAGPKDVAIGVS